MRQISLVGQVLPLGGLKGKILAPHPAGIKTVCDKPGGFLPGRVKEGIRLVYDP